MTLYSLKKKVLFIYRFFCVCAKLPVVVLFFEIHPTGLELFESVLFVALLWTIYSVFFYTVFSSFYK